MPYSEVDKISGLIKTFEDNFPELYVDVEMNSLEDAYIKMVENEQPQDQRQSSQHESSILNQSKQEAEATKLDHYMRTLPQTTFWT